MCVCFKRTLFSFKAHYRSKPSLSYFVAEDSYNFCGRTRLIGIRNAPTLVRNAGSALNLFIFFVSIQVFLTRYLFWVSLFLLFVAAISRVSFFGFLYLIMCFGLLYRGQNMLMDRKSRRIKRYINMVNELMQYSIRAEFS